MDEERAALARRALYQMSEFGHTIPEIARDRDDGLRTCTRCGDGVQLFARADRSNIGGTAHTTTCLGDICQHGWEVKQASDGHAVMRCLHCGAIRTEG
jgi:hypothetical protein